MRCPLESTCITSCHIKGADIRCVHFRLVYCHSARAANCAEASMANVKLKPFSALRLRNKRFDATENEIITEMKTQRFWLARPEINKALIRTFITQHNHNQFVVKAGGLNYSGPPSKLINISRGTSLVGVSTHQSGELFPPFRYS